MMTSSTLTPRIQFVFLLLIGLSTSNSALSQCTASFDYGGVDTVCVNTTLSFTDQSSSPNGIGAWAWSVNGGQISGAGGISSFQPTTEGIYEVVLEAFDVQLACSDHDTVTIVVLGNPSAQIDRTDMSCNGICDGTAEVFYDSQNSGAYTATWVGAGTEPLTGLCAGVYTAVITDDFGCTVPGTTLQEQIFEPDELVASISNGATVMGCPSGPDILLDLVVSGGTPNGNGLYNVVWSPSNGISEVNSFTPLLTPLSSNFFQVYTATVTDDRGCEITSDVQLLPSTSQVEGIITIGGSPCSDCDVVFLKPESGEWTRLFTVPTDASGHYLFDLVPGQTDFRLMADPSNVVFPDVLQGYYAGTESTHLWGQSLQLNSGCAASLQKNIDLPDAIQHNGQCTLRGGLYRIGPGKVQTDEDPIPLIDVVVEKTPPGSPQAKATTNANGEFEFNFMEYSDTVYALYVNIPGLPMNGTHQILVTHDDLLHDHLDLCVNLEGTFISTCTALGIEQPESEASVLSAYPNPSNGSFNLAMGPFVGSETQVNIFDISGRMVVGMTLGNAPKEKSISGLSQGYYLVRLANRNLTESLPISVLDF